jgi:hypothetical protein
MKHSLQDIDNKTNTISQQSVDQINSVHLEKVPEKLQSSLPDVKDIEFELKKINV